MRLLSAVKIYIQFCKCVKVLSCAHGEWKCNSLLQAQVNQDVLLQPRHQQSLSSSELCPEDLHECLHWLQDRQALLRSELLALQSLLPARCQPLRQQVNAFKL